MNEFLRNLEYGNIGLLIDQAKRNVEAKLDHWVPPLEAMRLLTEELARLMEVPDSMFESYCASVMHHFLTTLSPEDVPVFFDVPDADAGTGGDHA